MNKKYTGKEPEKIIYQNTINAIEDNIKYKIPHLRFVFIRGFQYYRVLEVIDIIDKTINGLEDPYIIKKIKKTKLKIENLRFAIVENEQYYNGFQITEILDETINDMIRKIFY